MSSFKKIKKASKYADCKNSGKESLLKYYGVKTERRVYRDDRYEIKWKFRNMFDEVACP